MPFQKLIMQYQCALLEVKTKFEVLNHELSIHSDQNPILSIESRIKNLQVFWKNEEKKH